MEQTILFNSLIIKIMAYYMLDTLQDWEEIEDKVKFIFTETQDYKEVIEDEITECKTALINKKVTIFCDSKPGVYFFVVKDKDTGFQKVAYVGCSVNLNRRLYCHPTHRFLFRKSHHDVFVFAIYSEKYRGLESSLIEKLSPFLNYEIRKKKKRFQY